MGRRIKVTEENYLEILDRIQRMTNRFKCLKHYRCVDMSNPGNPKLLYENKSWGTIIKNVERTDLSIEEKRELIMKNQFNELFEQVSEKFSVSKFVHATKHSFIESYLNSDNDILVGFKYKPLIHLDLDASSALVIDTGSKVEFTSYGFIVYVMHGVLDKDKDIWYIDRFIVDRSEEGRITNLEDEIAIRNSEWQEDAEYYNSLMDCDYSEDLW